MAVKIRPPSRRFLAACELGRRADQRHELRPGQLLVDLELRELVGDDHAIELGRDDGERLLPRKQPVVDQHAWLQGVALAFDLRPIAYLTNEQALAVPAHASEPHGLVRFRLVGLGGHLGGDVAKLN
jgi:hypothetical protein